MNAKRWRTDDLTVLKNNIKIATELGYSKTVVKKLEEYKGNEEAQIQVLHDARLGLID
nr:MAG TPA: hypothetical protein [Caudoviricetes sp.]